MARFIKNQLRGPVGPVNFRNVKGRLIVSAKVAPGTKKQTEASIVTADNFGKASATGMQVRASYHQQIVLMPDGGMHRRLNREFIAIYNSDLDKESGTFHFNADSFYALTNFEFNDTSRLKNRMLVQPDFVLEDGKLTISFPNHQERKFLKFPAGASACELWIAVTYLKTADLKCLRKPLLEEIQVEKDSNCAMGQNLSFDVPEGCVFMLSIFLKFNNSPTMKKYKNQNAGAICYTTFSPGTYSGEVINRWH